MKDAGAPFPPVVLVHGLCPARCLSCSAPSYSLAPVQVDLLLQAGVEPGCVNKGFLKFHVVCR